MKSILAELSDRVREAMTRAGIDGDPMVRRSQDEKFGHFQSNCAMGVAKRAGRKPRDVAQAICDELDLDDMCEPAQIAGPGFINLTLTPDYLSRFLGGIPGAGTAEGERLGIDPAPDSEIVAVDLSSPNLAKEMHVGHLRSTVIGDCVCRILEFEGHTVHRENHVGDWGTQFGMLVAHLRDVKPDVAEAPEDLVISDLESFYVEAKARFDADDDFKTASREAVVALQAGEKQTKAIWRAFCDESLRHCHAIYDRLGVKVIDRGESFYNDLMPKVLDRLKETEAADGKPLARESDGALCVFLDGFTTRDGEQLPLIVRKSDGGYNYATSDLATIIHRLESLETTRIIYVVGLSQKLHFEMVFAAARAAGWASDEVVMEHLGFGNMLSASGKPFKTREGGTVKLKDLLDEAVDRARSVITQDADLTRREKDLTEEQVEQIAEAVGLGAVKYFDLSHSLNKDYKFDLDTMLSLDGNTAPYMMYAYARIRAIGRKAGVAFEDLPAGEPLQIEHPAEVRLALTLSQFAEVLDIVARDLKPNILTDYLYELARAFSRFYDKKLGVRVIDAEREETRVSRLRLCDLTARTLKIGLNLLGINTVEQM